MSTTTPNLALVKSADSDNLHTWLTTNLNANMDTLDNAVTLTGTQTLTNKTLTAPSISTINLTGGQIAFPATQSASATANTLDDYGEGTFTPAVGGSATYTVQDGRYTKIGDRCFFSVALTINAIGTGSTSVISGLPFASKASSSAVTFYAVGFSSLAINSLNLVAYNTSNTSTLTFQHITAAGVSMTDSPAVLGNSAVTRMCGNYQTAT